MNPFDSGSPADETLFSGRQRELIDADDSFERTFQDRADHILFYGPRGFGKTSIINHLQTKYSTKKALFVFCGLGECSSMDEVVEQFVTRFYREVSASNIWNKLLTGIRSLFSTIKGINIGKFGITFENKEGIRQITPHFTDLLEKCWKEMETTNCSCLVVVFDEADKLANSEELAENFVFAIRTSIEEMGRRGITRVKFVLSAIPEVRKKIETLHESLLRSLRIIELGNFDEEAVRELMDKGISASGLSLTYEPEFLTALVRLSNGIPFHVQAICHSTFDANEDDYLSQEDLRAGVFGAVKRLNQYPFGPWWKQVENWTHAKLFLEIMASKQGYATLDHLEKKLNIVRASVSTLGSRLREIGFLSNDGAPGTYALSSQLCRLWIDKKLRNLSDTDINLG